MKFRKYAMNKGKNKEKGADILAYYTGKVRKNYRKCRNEQYGHIGRTWKKLAIRAGYCVRSTTMIGIIIIKSIRFRRNC